MRNPSLAILALVALLGSGCGRLVNIRVSDVVETTVERGTIIEELIGSLGFDGLTAIDVFDAQELQNQGVEPGDVKRVELVQFDLEAVAPDDADLAFLEKLELYVEAPDLPKELVASSTDFPDGEAFVALDLTGLDLTDYVVSRSMTLSTEIRGSRPDADTDVTATWALRIGVTGQGLVNGARGD